MSILSSLSAFFRDNSLGIVSAMASVGFAGYMLVFGGGGGGAGLMGGSVVVSHVPVNSPLKERPQQALTPTRYRTIARRLPEEDLLITGSLRAQAPEGPPEGAARARSAREAPPVSYVLRFATPDIALVEGSGRLWSVGRGDLLPGAGRVVDIEQRARDRWVVKTFDGKTIQEIGAQ